MRPPSLPPLQRVARALVPVVAAAGLLVVLLVFVFPTGTVWDQRRNTSRAEQELSLLRQENADLEERAVELQDDAKVEQLARERYGMVRPGEEAYVVLPTPEPVTPREEEDDPGLIERTWDAITGFF